MMSLIDESLDNKYFFNSVAGLFGVYVFTSLLHVFKSLKFKFKKYPA